MKEVVRATIISPGVLFNNQSTDPDQVFEFTKPQAFTFKESSAYFILESLFDGNGVEATCWDKPNSTFRPSGMTLEVKSTTIFGSNPNFPISETFGEPPKLTAEYLGHPERALWKPILLNNQSDQFNPEATGQIESYAPQFLRYYIAPSPTLRTNIYRIDTDTSNTADPKTGFTGKAMWVTIIGLLDNKKPNSDLNLKTALIIQPDQDNLIRVLNCGNLDLALDRKVMTSNIISNLARVNLFFRKMNPNSPGYEWLETGLPIHILNATYDYIAGPDYHPKNPNINFIANWNKTMINRYGIDLYYHFTNVSQQDLKIETQRLNDLISRLTTSK